MLATYQQHTRAKLAGIVISVLVVAGVVLLADHLKAEQAEARTASSVSTSTTAISASNNAASSASVPNTTGTPTDTTNNANASGYKNGTYTASANYFVPHSNESIQVTATLNDGTISDVSINNSEGDRTSASFQEDFAFAYKSYVVGKKISGLQLDAVAGASDTTEGFNEALSQIAARAHS